VWACEVASLAGRAGFRVSLLEGTRHISTAEFLDGLATDSGARRVLAGCLAYMPFPAFFWEVAAVSSKSANLPFECVALPAPALARAVPDAQSFAEHFSKDRSVVRFVNLGGDATLVVPCPPRQPSVTLSAYSHLAAFLRQAPSEQQDLLLQEVGRAARDLLRAQPFWLSTSGAGVAWVHVRIDSRPKYYQYSPFRQERSGP